MGYLVNGKCYLSEQQATDVYFSGVAPLLTPDSIHQVQKINGKWFYQSEQIPVSLPECSVQVEILTGNLIGFAFVLIMAAAYGFNLLRKAI